MQRSSSARRSSSRASQKRTSSRKSTSKLKLKREDGAKQTNWRIDKASISAAAKNLKKSWDAVELKAEQIRDSAEEHVLGRRSVEEKKRFRVRAMFATVLIACAVSWSETLVGASRGALLPSPKIVKGNVAARGRYLYAANLIRLPNDHMCGGSLVREDFVLTAAHCVEEMKQAPWRYKILVANHDLGKSEEEEEEFQVLDVAVHPQRRQSPSAYDFALIRLHGKSKHTVLKLDDGSTKLQDSSPLTVIGWGLTESESISPVLKEVGLKYVDQKKCVDAWNMLRIEVTDSMLCALPKDNKPWRSGGAWNGDSGGPLIVKEISDSGAPRADICVGVVSWGLANYKNNGGFPGVYGRVSEGYEWIQDEMKKPPARLKPLRPPKLKRVPIRQMIWWLQHKAKYGYQMASRIASFVLCLPFLLRYTTIERRLGIDLDETISSIRFSLLVAVLLLPMIPLELFLYIYYGGP